VGIYRVQIGESQTRKNVPPPSDERLFQLLLDGMGLNKVNLNQPTPGSVFGTSCKQTKCFHFNHSPSMRMHLRQLQPFHWRFCFIFSVHFLYISVLKKLF